MDTTRLPKRSLWYYSTSFRQMVGFAAISTAFLSAIAIGCFHKREYDIRSEPYYKEAMKKWKDSATAKFLIGEPISLKYIEVFHHKNSITNETANFFIPFKGQNYNGKMNVDASLKDKEWILNELTLELDSDLSDKKFVVFRTKEKREENDNKTKSIQNESKESE